MRKLLNTVVYLLGCQLLLAGVSAHAVAPVEAVALFKDRAMVRTVHGQELIRVGQTSKGGVTLLASDPSMARVRYEGEVYQLTLSTRVGSNFSKPSQNSLRVSRDQLGQYRVRGSINGHLVPFLIDTGASYVALSGQAAQQMGLDYRSGSPATVSTAQGSSPAFTVNLTSVTVGSITRYNVAAFVIEGSYPTEALLGMSFLSQVSMRDEGNVLTITSSN